MTLLTVPGGGARLSKIGFESDLRLGHNNGRMLETSTSGCKDVVGHASLFSQVLSLIDRGYFARRVKALNAERCAKGFTCWGQLVAMLFCQLAQAKSLREIEQGWRSCEGKLRHLGVDEYPRRSTLAYANEHRPWELYRSVFHALLERCMAIAPGKRFRFKNKLLSMDATVIELCATMFDWAADFCFFFQQASPRTSAGGSPRD
jgi:hypothetical protein